MKKVVSGWRDHDRMRRIVLAFPVLFPLIAIAILLVLWGPGYYLKGVIGRARERVQFQRALWSYDQQALKDMAIHGASTRVAVQAASRIVDQQILRSVLDEAGGRIDHAILGQILSRMTNADWLVPADAGYMDREMWAISVRRQVKGFPGLWSGCLYSGGAPVYTNQSELARMVRLSGGLDYIGVSHVVDTGVIQEIVLDCVVDTDIARSLVSRLSDAALLERAILERGYCKEMATFRGRDLSEYFFTNAVLGCLSDQAALGRVAIALRMDDLVGKIWDPEVRVKVEADMARLKQVGVTTDAAELLRIAQNDRDWWMREAAIQGVGDAAALAGAATSDSSWRVRLAALRKCKDNGVVRSIVTNDPSWHVRREALEIVADDALLEESLRHDPSAAVRCRAAALMTNVAILAEAVVGEECSLVGAIAVRKIDDVQVLRRISETTRLSGMRMLAERRIQLIDFERKRREAKWKKNM